MAAPVIVSADRIIEGARKTYQTIPTDDTYAQDVVIRVVAGLLDLEGEDYADLIRHLISADEVDADALRWVTVKS